MVPTHNLYDFVHQVTEKRFALLYLYPFGSRDLKHNVFHHLSDPANVHRTAIKQNAVIADKVFPRDLPGFEQRIVELQPTIFCHDQEPLNFDLYQDHNIDFSFIDSEITDQWRPKNLNLRYCCIQSNQTQWILLHSEVNSPEVKKYEDTGLFVGAYWWSHAVIARDWYRFAEIDSMLATKIQYEKLFLIYCRDFTGSRSYRKCFIDLVTKHGLDQYSQLGSMHNREISSNTSAEYHADDFINTAISIVLETVFDDRVHLTEKILRPIACGHPFILAAGPHALALLKSYGFKTFSPWINEDYDLEINSTQRLEKIINEMIRISKISKSEQTALVQNCREIAEFNRQHFFSQQFYDKVTQELYTNVMQADAARTPSMNFDFYRCFLKLPRRFDAKIYVKKLLDFIDSGGSFEQYQCHEHGLDDESCTNGYDV